MTVKRSRSQSRLITSSQSYQPTEIIQCPSAAKASEKRGYGWGMHLPHQRAGAIILAIRGGHHACSAMSDYIVGSDPSAAANPSMLLKICKSLALTGLLVPYIEALPQNRMRFMFFLAWAPPDTDSEYWRHLLTLEESNERVPEADSAITRRWVA